MASIQGILRRLADKFQSVIGAQRIRLFGYPVLRNVNRMDGTGSAKHALLVYLVEPFRLRRDHPRFHDHQNMKQSLHIASALGDAGYVVDVVDVCDERYFQQPPEREYNLILSHRVDLGVMGQGISPGTKQVYLSTGMNHTVHNHNLLSRYARLRERRACALDAPALNTEHMPFVKSADAIAGFGNRVTVGTWREATAAPMFPFNNYGGAGMPLERNFDSARNNFLFFASREQVGKGLDLLLEIFPRYPRLHLFVCSLFRNEPAFCRCYGKELFQTPNIHAIGATRAASDAFRELAARCAFIVLPSCTEGQPGSVLQAMQTGLIPLLTRECGIEVGDFGWLFEDDSEAAIGELILRVSGLPAGELRSRSATTLEVARSTYTEAAFISRWKDIAAEFGNLPQKGF